jgi:hypothetical protein
MDCLWNKVETRFEISDFSMRAFFQLHWFWAREQGFELNSRTWANHYAGLLQAGALIPVIACLGGLPVGTIELMLFTEPFSGESFFQADKAFTMREWRSKGIVGRAMMKDVHMGSLARMFGCTKVVVPSTLYMVNIYRKVLVKEGFNPKVHSQTLIMEIN